MKKKIRGRRCKHCDDSLKPDPCLKKNTGNPCRAL